MDSLWNKKTKKKSVTLLSDINLKSRFLSFGKRPQDSK